METPLPPFIPMPFVFSLSLLPPSSPALIEPSCASGLLDEGYSLASLVFSQLLWLLDCCTNLWLSSSQPHQSSDNVVTSLASLDSLDFSQLLWFSDCCNLRLSSSQPHQSSDSMRPLWLSWISLNCCGFPTAAANMALIEPPVPP